ncbi:MAG: serine/threonine-protein kinase [Deltaproteobacteria bacterium]|nr:serine/threonine-protein kinase [Deltaproteobacteria bacterium]
MVSIGSPLPLGRFKFSVVREIGRGGFGIVDEIKVLESNASGTRSGTHLARKRLNDNFATHPEARERFDREIEQVRAMKHIDGVVNFRGQNVPGGTRFYVMPLYPNNLRSYLASCGIQPLQNTARFCAAIADTLVHAHALGFIHRDLKPENILLNDNNTHVVADWGLGYFMHQQSKVLIPLTRGGMGSEYYCSLEQWATGKCDQTGDVYSLGMMAAELVLGEQATLVYQGAGITVDLLPGNDRSSKLFNAAVRRMTNMVPHLRPQSMSDVASELRALA